MQNIFIEFLPPWVETGLQPAFYDKESGTVLQQVSRMYYKINELIESNNDLAQKFIELKDYVDNYLDHIDFDEMVSDKLDEMASDGTLAELINQEIFGELNDKINTVTTINTKFAQKILSNTNQIVVFAGDSLTYGQDPVTHTQSANPYPALVQSFIRNWYENASLITCYNYGVAAAQSSAGLTNFNTYLALNPSTIFWSYGTNDITNNVSISQIITNLDKFYTKCIDNSIELIVIIPPMNYYTAARQKGMAMLHDAMVSYCKSRGIVYVDAYEYVQNLYTSLSTTVHVLQSDETHFSDYTCFRDAILSTLLPIAYVQDGKKFDYINVGRNRQYVKTNLSATNVATAIDPFDDGLVISSDIGNTFSINIQVTKPSVLSFVGYTRSTAGSAIFNLDGTNYTIDESTGSGTTVPNNNFTLDFPVVLNAGMHNVTLHSVTFGDDQSRYYIYGFQLKESSQSLAPKGYRQMEAEHQLWHGSSSSLSATTLALDVKQFNELVVSIGAADSLQTFVCRPFHPWDKFSADTTYKLPTTYGDVVGIATFAIDIENNSFTYSTTETAPIRSIYGFYTNDAFDEPMISAPTS